MAGRVARSLADARRRDPRMRSEAFDAQGQSGVADDRRVDRAGEAFRFEAENARAGIEVVADYRREPVSVRVRATADRTARCARGWP